MGVRQGSGLEDNQFNILDVARIGKFRKMILPLVVLQQLNVNVDDRIVFLLDKNGLVYIVPSKQFKRMDEKPEFIKIS